MVTTFGSVKIAPTHQLTSIYVEVDFTASTCVEVDLDRP